MDDSEATTGTASTSQDAAVNTNVQNEARIPGEEPFSQSFVIQVTALASLGGVLFGYDLGVISGALPHLTDDFGLSKSEQEFVVSILYLGGGFGAAVGGSLCDSVGRRKAILVTDVLFAVGAAILLGSHTIGHLYCGRFVVGFAVAVSGVADVSYLHEIAPLQWRGAIVSVNEACISLGFLLAYFCSFLLGHLPAGWRFMFGGSGLLAILQFLGMWGMPESPVWLKDQGRLEESEQALQRIRGGIPQTESTSYNTVHFHSAHQSIPETTGNVGYNSAVEDPATFEEESRRSSGSFTFEMESFGHGGTRCRTALHYLGLQGSLSFLHSLVTRYRQQTYIALFLSVTQQFCGQTNVLSYAPFIFETAEDTQSDESAGIMLSTVFIGVVKFAVTVLVIWKIEYVGRRFLLLAGMMVILLGLLFLTLSFAMVGSVRDISELGRLLALPGVLLVVCGYSMSFGPLTWLLTSELFPTDIRGRALGASTIITYLCASIVTSTFLSAQSWLGASTVFALYALVTAAGIIFSFLAIPDTGGKTFKEAEDSVLRMWWWTSSLRDTSIADTIRLARSTGSASNLV